MFCLWFSYLSVRGISPNAIARDYYKNMNVYKASLMTTLVIRVLFHLPDKLGSLLFDPHFAYRR
jgi:hypothetical protein